MTMKKEDMYISDCTYSTITLTAKAKQSYLNHGNHHYNLPLQINLV